MGNPYAHGTLRGRIAEAQRGQPRVSLRDVTPPREQVEPCKCPVCNAPTDSAGDGRHALWCSRNQ